MDQTVKITFGSIIQEPLGVPKFWCYFRVLWTIYFQMHTLFIKKGVDNFEIEHQNVILRGNAVSP